MIAPSSFLTSVVIATIDNCDNDQVMRDKSLFSHELTTYKPSDRVNIFSGNASLQGQGMAMSKCKDETGIAHEKILHGKFYFPNSPINLIIIVKLVKDDHDL